MGFYISKSLNYSNRKCELLICPNYLFQENIFSFVTDKVTLTEKPISFKNSFKKHLLIVDNIQNISSILSRKELSRFYSIEIITDSISEEFLSSIANHLKENEISIGLLVPSEDIIFLNSDLINQFNIHISLANSFEDAVCEAPKKVFKNASNLKFSFSQCASITKTIDTRKDVEKPLKKDLDESFQNKLFRYLNKSKKTNVEIYTKAGITRQVFSKIIGNDNYVPKKPTIVCLIIGLELDIDDALDLLNAAGYTLSNSIRFDKIVKTFITLKDFNLDSINFELDKYNEPILGWKPRDD